MTTDSYTSPKVRTESVPTLIPPEAENPEHKVILLAFIEKGELPRGWMENPLYLMQRTESRNVALERDRTRIVINGGRFRMLDEGGTEWRNLPVDPDVIYKPTIKDGLGGEKPTGGLTVVEPDGKLVFYPSDDPKGAYWPEALSRKIATTERAEEIAKTQNIDVILPRYTAAHVFEIKGKQVAAGVYEIPRCILYGDYMKAKQNEYKARYQQYFAIGAFFRAGYIHPQLHSANRAVFYIPEKGMIPVLLDWEDAYDISEYSEERTTDLEIGGSTVAIPVSPKEKALFFGLQQAVKADMFELFYEPAGTVDEIMDVVLDTYISPMVAGYLGLKNGDAVDTYKLLEQFNRASRAFSPEGKEDFWDMVRKYAENWALLQALIRLDTVEIEGLRDRITILSKEITVQHSSISVIAAMAMVLMQREQIPYQNTQPIPETVHFPSTV